MGSKALQSTIEISGVLSHSLQKAITKAVDRLGEMEKEVLASAGAAEKLCAEMDTQESVLKSLQKGYADYIVSGQESSEEAQTLARKIKALSEELKKNQDTIKAAEAAAEKLANGQDDAGDAYSRLEKKIESQQDELQQLQREYANVVLEQGKTSAEARQLEGRISSLSGELKDNKKRLQDVGEAAEEAGDKANKSGDGYTMLKDVISDLATEAIQAAIDKFKELAIEGDEALAKLEARTGATAGQIAGYEDVLHDIYNAGYGDSLEGVTDALATVIQMTDNLDKATLTNVTKNAIALEDVFGFDVKESIRAANSLMDQFGITSDEAFNLIVQGAQRGLNQNDDLLDTINEYSVQFKNAGYTADDMFNMLSNGVEAGTWSVDKLGDAVKEMNIRLNDGTADEALGKLGLGFKVAKNSAADLERAAHGVSKAELNIKEAQAEANEALKEHGRNSIEYKKALNAVTDAKYSLSDAEGKYNELAGETSYNLDRIKGQLAAGGETAQAAMNEIMTALMNVEDEQERYVLGQQIMGTMWEDLGADTVAALMNTEGAISKTNEAMKQMDASAYDTLGASFTELGRAMEAEIFRPLVEAITPAVKLLVDFLINNMPLVKGLLAGVAAAIISLKWGSIVSGIGRVAGAFKALGALFATNPIGLVILGITALVTAFSYLWENCEGFRNFWIKLWEGIKSAASAVTEWLVGAVGAIVRFFSGGLSSIGSMFSAAKDKVLSIAGNIKTGTSKKWSEISSAASEKWEKIRSTIGSKITAAQQNVSSVTGKIKSVTSKKWSEISSATSEKWEKIRSTVGSKLSSAKSTASSVLNSITSTMKSKFNAALKTTTSIFSRIVNSIKEKMNAAKNAVANAIQKLKDKFNFSWSLPKLKLPHFKVSGKFSLNPPSVPKFSIDWYKDGGILTQPTIFGAMGSKLLAGGEAGAEAVLPLSVLWDKMEAILRRILSDKDTGGTSDAGLTSKAGELLTLDNFSLGSLASNTSTVIYYDFSNFTWSPHIQTGGTGDDEDDFMAKLRAHEAEFFDWLEEFVQMREVALYGA